MIELAHAGKVINVHDHNLMMRVEMIMYMMINVGKVINVYDNDFNVHDDD